MNWSPRWCIIITVSLSLFLQQPYASCAQTCSLYELATGLVCFYGDEVTKAITNSTSSWVVEFYSSWCGHCQRLAPTWQELAQNIKAWSSVVQLGVIDCSKSDNYQTCSEYHVRAYPSIRFFHPYERNPRDSTKQHSGGRGSSDLRKAIVDLVESVSNRPLHWPNLQPFVSDKLLSLPSTAWTPTVLVFEDQDSYLGKELILDFSSLKSLTVTRVSNKNVALVKHYSILEFPSIVLEMEKDKYHVISGHTFSDPRMEFKKHIQEYVTATAGRPSQLARVPPSHRGPANRHNDIRHSLTMVNRVNKMDLLSGISYAFRMEVTLHHIVSGSAFTALLRFVYLLESAFRSAYLAIADSLCAVRIKLEMRQSSGFILSRDWIRILDTKLDPELFPKEPQWSSCLGSQSQYRGYPCSLWTLMHTVTVLTLPVKSRLHIPAKNRVNSKEALYILSGFIRNFFSCEYCREHFTQMAQSLTDGVIHHNGDAVMWLWEAHNTVNKRLKDDISSDPLHPKVLFPTSQMCPYCYTCPTSRDESVPEDTCHLKIQPSWNNTGFVNGESLLHTQQTEQPPRYVWNRTAVLLFLWNFYHINKNDSSMPTEILRVAWPKKFDNVKVLHEQYYSTDLGLNGYDISLCVVYYMMCVLCLAMVTFWLLRRRRLRFFMF